MRKFDQFEKEFFVACCQEATSEGNPVRSDLVLYKYDLQPDWSWDALALQNLEKRGLVRVTHKHGAHPYFEVSLDEEAISKGEKLNFEGISPPLSSTYLTDQLVNARQSYDSSAWTGRTLSTTERVELVANIDEALRKIDLLNISQEKKSQARSFLCAARELVEAPDPPFNLIEYILRYVDRIIGIAGLFVGVAGLIVAAGN